MNKRLLRNPRLKLGVTAGAALATAGFFGLMRAQTPTHAGPQTTPTAAASPAPAPVNTPAIGTPAPNTLSPVPPASSGSAQPQVPPAPRLRPSARTRAS